MSTEVLTVYKAMLLASHELDFVTEVRRKVMKHEVWETERLNDLPETPWFTAQFLGPQAQHLSHVTPTLVSYFSFSYLQRDELRSVLMWESR